MKRKILYISMCLPFEKAFHAGGKTFNYYINSFAEDKNNEVTLIAKVLPDEEKFISSISKLIRFLSVAAPKSGMKKYISVIKSLNSKINPFYKYGNTLQKDIYDQIESHLKSLKSNGYDPDVVILEWTQMLLFIDVVKKYFPNAVYVGSEHDVRFLGLKRKAEGCRNALKKAIMERAYLLGKKRELEAVNGCDLVVTHNKKDQTLLVENGISKYKLDVIAPYFDRFVAMDRKSGNRDILYYGAMNRMENSSAAVWFIENVMPMLQDLNVRFIVIGNKPPEELKKFQSDRIIITGFVEDPTQYFATAMCLVAPLLYGAGIKVKILEALSSGVPVLTNDIGIEGIDAVDGESYFHCIEAKDYADIIFQLVERKIDAEKISNAAMQMIESQYDLRKSYENYSSCIWSLVDRKKEKK